jgi:putative endonuclease
MVERVRLRRINRQVCQLNPLSHSAIVVAIFRVLLTQNMFTVYILRSLSTGNFYTGQSSNFEQRLLNHQLGLARYTHGRGPWEVVYKEEYATRAEAMQPEHFLKSGKGREWLKLRFKDRKDNSK